MPRRSQRQSSKEGAGNGSASRSGGRPMWSGTISFGLVSVPVRLVSAVKSGGVPLNLLDRDGTPLKRRYFCPKDKREVHSEHIIRGFELDDGEHIPVTEEELEGLEPQKSRNIDLQVFVDAQEIDPIYFERPYFLVPDGGSDKAYGLLADAMEESGKAGIARFVMRDKEYLVTIIAEQGLLRAQTMRFHDEVRSPDDIGLKPDTHADSRGVSRITNAIKALSKASLQGADLSDHHTQRMLALIASKFGEGKDVVESQEAPPEEGAEGSVENLRAALSRSLAEAKRQAGKAANRGRHEEPRHASAHDRRRGRPTRTRTRARR